MQFLGKAFIGAVLLSVAPTAANATELFQLDIDAQDSSVSDLDKPYFYLKNLSTAGETIASFKLSFTGFPNIIIDAVDNFSSIGGVSPSIQRTSVTPTNMNGQGQAGLEIVYVAPTFQPTDTSRFRADFDIVGQNGSNVDFRSILFANSATATVTFGNGKVETFSLGAPSDRALYTYKNSAPAVAPVPEPATWAMLLGGLSIVGVSMRRRNERNIQFA